MIDIEDRRALLERYCRIIRKLLVQDGRLGLLGILQDIGRIERDTRRRPDEEFGEVVERYGIVFARLRDVYEIITPKVFTECFSDHWF